MEIFVYIFLGIVILKVILAICGVKGSGSSPSSNDDYYDHGPDD